MTRRQAKLQGISATALITLLIISYGQKSCATDAQYNRLETAKENYTFFDTLPVPERLFAPINELSTEIITIIILGSTIVTILLILCFIWCYLDTHPKSILSIANFWVSKSNRRLKARTFSEKLFGPSRRPNKIKNTEMKNSDNIVNSNNTDNVVETKYNTDFINVALEFLEYEIPAPAKTSFSGEDV